MKGRFTRRRAIDSLQALYDRGEGCVCERLGEGESCHCGWITALASESVEEEDEQDDEEEEAGHGDEEDGTHTAEEDAPNGEQQQQQPQQQQRQRNFRWFTLETAESIKINYEFLRDLMAHALANNWDVESIRLIDLSTLELERYFGRVRDGARGTPTVAQFARADANVREDSYLRRLPIEERWNLGASKRGNVEGMQGAGSDGRTERRGAGLFLLLRKPASYRSRGADLSAERAAAGAVHHELKNDAAKRSLANVANKSNGGCCTTKLLPPGVYVQTKDLGAAATLERRCAVYWSDKSSERTDEQKAAGEKGRWWSATSTGVEVAHGQVLLAITYDAQFGEGSSKDTVNVRSEQVVWL